MAVTDQTDISTLQADIQQLRNDFSKMTTTIRDLATNGLSRAGETAHVSADKMWGEVKRQAVQVGHEIEERPFASAAAAFATGLMLGLMFSGRRG